MYMLNESKLYARVKFLKESKYLNFACIGYSKKVWENQFHISDEELLKKYILTDDEKNAQIKEFENNLTDIESS